MIDIVYILGGGSHWDNNEIRYSLRSVEKHLSNYRNIYIIGRLPDFLQGVIYIPMEDMERCKETNIYLKILRACQEDNISDNFLFFNDDHFLVSDFDAPTFPFFMKGDLSAVARILRPGQMYRECVVHTGEVLFNGGHPTLNFDTHTPIVYNKVEFIRVMQTYDWTQKYGYIVKSLYANTLNIQGIYEPDCKLNFVAELEEILGKLRQRKVWSIGDRALGNTLQQAMDILYPTPSKWEKQGA